MGRAAPYHLWPLPGCSSPLSHPCSSSSEEAHLMLVIVGMMASHVIAQHVDTSITAPSVESYIGQWPNHVHGLKINITTQLSTLLALLLKGQLVSY